MPRLNRGPVSYGNVWMPAQQAMPAHAHLSRPQYSHPRINQNAIAGPSNMTSRLYADNDNDYQMGPESFDNTMYANPDADYPWYD